MASLTRCRVKGDSLKDVIHLCFSLSGGEGKFGEPGLSQELFAGFPKKKADVEGTTKGLEFRTLHLPAFPHLLQVYANLSKILQESNLQPIDVTVNSSIFQGMLERTRTRRERNVKWEICIPGLPFLGKTGNPGTPVCPSYPLTEPEESFSLECFKDSFAAPWPEKQGKTSVSAGSKTDRSQISPPGPGKRSRKE